MIGLEKKIISIRAQVPAFWLIPGMARGCHMQNPPGQKSRDGEGFGGFATQGKNRKFCICKGVGKKSGPRPRFYTTSGAGSHFLEGCPLNLTGFPFNFKGEDGYPILVEGFPFTRKGVSLYF